jgi:S1-C subfamily serine protease
VAAVGLLAGCGGGGDKTTGTATGTAQPTRTQVGVLESSGAGGRRAFDPEAIYKSEAPGVVTLVSLGGSARNVLGRPSEALGSGFAVDDKGHIATNAHVVTTGGGTEARQVYAQFADGNRLPAHIVGTDPNADVALVKVDPSELRGPNARIVPLPLGSTTGVQVGDPVAAIGSPFGEQQSLSVGVVSALNREIESLTNFSIGNAIQTDAAINHGNSGGPLLDAAGRVIGINSQIRSTGGGGEGVGFAVPVETVRRSIDQLRQTGRVDYAYLGISSVTLYPQLGERLGLKAMTGALVDSVQPGGPADKAGLREAKSHIVFQGVPRIPVGGDAILAVDGKKVTAGDDLTDLIALHQAGDTVQLRIERGSTERTIDVKLGKRPAPSD